ncbi:MAG: S1C family serine protease [Sandaracinaceae bacterium]
MVFRRSLTSSVLAPLALVAMTHAFAAPDLARAQPAEEQRIRVARLLQESTVSIVAGPSSGSGFVTGDERWIVTNSHVIEPGRRSGVVVHFSSGVSRRADVLLDSPSHDLAVLAVAGEVPARPLNLGDSDQVSVGQSVLAFGSPFGLEGTLTQGIISAIRTVPPGSRLGGGAVSQLIQTDAPINPGNSGGPLVSADGHVIGVNTAILSRTGGSHGIGFAVPSNHVRALLQEVRQRRRQPIAGRDEEPSRPDEPPSRAQAGSPAYLGILGSDFRARGVRGVRIQQVVPGSPAQSAGLAGVADEPPVAVRRLGVPWTGHIIVAVDGHPTPTMQALQTTLGRHNPGERAVLTVTVGPDAVSGEAVVTLGQRPAE